MIMPTLSDWKKYFEAPLAFLADTSEHLKLKVTWRIASWVTAYDFFTCNLDVSFSKWGG